MLGWRKTQPVRLYVALFLNYIHRVGMSARLLEKVSMTGHAFASRSLRALQSFFQLNIEEVCKLADERDMTALEMHV
jgi:hypothetical protein